MNGAPTADRPILGIALMLGFCLLAPLSDVIAKILGQSMSIGQLVTVRFAVMGFALLPIVALTTGLAALILRGRIFTLMVIRTILHLIGTAAFFTALQYLPIADALAIVFVLPFMMLLAGKVFLREEVGARRLIACAVGFCGTLMVIQPAFADVGWPALLPLLVALVFTAFMLITRMIAKQVDAIALQATSGLTATLFMVPVMIFAGQADIIGFALSPVTYGEALMLLTLGALASLAHVMMTLSLRFAPSATLAPIQYAEIPFAALAGWLVFSDIPNGLAAAGIMVTMLAGLYIIFREGRISRQAPEPPRPNRQAAG